MISDSAFAPDVFSLTLFLVRWSLPLLTAAFTSMRLAPYIIRVRDQNPHVHVPCIDVHVSVVQVGFVLWYVWRVERIVHRGRAIRRTWQQTLIRAYLDPLMSFVDFEEETGVVSRLVFNVSPQSASSLRNSIVFYRLPPGSKNIASPFSNRGLYHCRCLWL